MNFWDICEILGNAVKFTFCVAGVAFLALTVAAGFEHSGQTHRTCVKGVSYLEGKSLTLQVDEVGKPVKCTESGWIDTPYSGASK